MVGRSRVVLGRNEWVNPTTVGAIGQGSALNEEGSSSDRLNFYKHLALFYLYR